VGTTATSSTQRRHLYYPQVGHSTGTSSTAGTSFVAEGLLLTFPRTDLDADTKHTCLSITRAHDACQKSLPLPGEGGRERNIALRR
jgi:hypothetical protein